MTGASGECGPIWFHEEDRRIVRVIDQRYLPHRFQIRDLRTSGDVIESISEMVVRGAPLIGIAAACGMYLAALEARDGKTLDRHLAQTALRLKASRPTAVNLAWAVDRQLAAISTAGTWDEKIQTAFITAKILMEEDAEICKKIGTHGLAVLRGLARAKERRPLNVLTHCNAGWLAAIQWGTATSPIYQAHDEGIPVHVWVDETRPRNQGAGLTAWELGRYGVPHTVIADNTGGHLMQHGKVDVVIVGADRVTRTGDVANKIGTYLKALAARDNGIPFYAAVPSSTVDWSLKDGLREIPVEERSGDEVRFIQGLCCGEIKKVLLTPEDSPAVNYGFDVTPARLITGLMTERGICPATEEGLLGLFPEKKAGVS